MAADFRRAFDGPAVFWDPEREERIVTEPRAVAGMLELPTGRLAIHDPGYESAPDPLDRDVPPGAHVVDLALRSWRNQDGIERASTLRIRIHEGTAPDEPLEP